MKHHERIWLQTEAESTGEMTWCEDKINDDDVEYVRVDLFIKLEAENERLNKAFDWSAVKVADLKAENEALREAVKNTLLTEIGEPIGIVGRQVLHEALK